MPDSGEVTPYRGELNPYHDEGLRNVWKQGWRAFWQGKPPPDREVFDDPKEMTAWLDGYAAAQNREPGG